MSEIYFFLLDVSHVALILFVEAAACTDQRNGLGAESASHNLSLVDWGRWGREDVGSIRPKTCGMAQDCYCSDDIFLQRRPEECGGCNLGHIPTPSSVYLHSFSSSIPLGLMEAIKKSSSSCSCSFVKTNW